jgi:hypothetical protein
MHIEPYILESMGNKQLMNRIVNSIFDEIEGVRCIELTCTIKNIGEWQISVTSVNGLPDGFSFKAWLKAACERVVRLFEAELSDLPFHEKDLLIKRVQNRCRKLGAIPDLLKPEPNHKKLRVHVNDATIVTADHWEQVVRYSRRYFIIRHYYLRELADRLQMIFAFDHYTHRPEVNANIFGDFTRLQTTFSVQHLAAFARVLFESGFFNETNKLLVCRTLAGVFSTPRQKEISSRSFGNHFTQPDPPSLLQIAENLGKWMKIAEKLRHCEDDM